MLYYRGSELFAARLGRHKAHFQTQPGYGPGRREEHDPPLLFDLGVDPGEKFNVAAENTQAIADIRALVAQHEKTIEPVTNQLDRANGQ